MAPRLLILLFGVFCSSTSVLWIKESGCPSVLLAGYRLLVGAVVLSPLFFRDRARHRGAFGAADLSRTVLPGVVVAVHLILWIVGARMTRAANATLIVNMLPVAMPFFLLAMVGERITRAELIGTAVAMAGVAVLAGADYTFSRRAFFGDLVCLAAMLLFALYMTLGSKNRHFASIWLYVVPLYFIGGLLCLAVALVAPGGPHPETYDVKELAMIAGLGLIPTVFGHSALLHSMKHLRGQMVSLVNVFQFVFAGVLAAVLLKEAPVWTFYPAAALVVIGVVIVLRYHRRPAQRA